MRYVKGLGTVEQRFGISNKEMIANAISGKTNIPVKDLMKKSITDLRKMWKELN